MTRQQAVELAHKKLKEFGLQTWHVAITTDITSGFLGMCSHQDETIILSAHHIDIHDDKMVENTILHEVAHALTPGHSHDLIWRNKAKEIGCYDTNPCSNLAFTAEAIDAIRSGAMLEIEVEETVVRTPKFKVTRLQDKCPECGKVAVETRSIETDDLFIKTLQCGHKIIKRKPRATPFDKWISDDADPNCKHEWDRTFCVNCLAKRPAKFQVEGMRAIERGLVLNKGFGVFDDMGLGKTIQGFGYLKFHPESFPVLCIVKSGLLFQFFKQSLIWLGDKYVGQVIRSSQEPIIPNLKMYFISYDLLVPKTRKLKSGKIVTQGFDIQKLIKRGIKTIILDECQLIKNPDSSRTQQVRRLVKEVEKVIPLSGTPWKNRGSEFFAVLNMIAPTKFNSHQGFLQRWVDYYWDGNKYKEGGIRNIPAFKEYVKDLVIRREYDEVMDDFPEVSRVLHYVDIDGTSQEMYDEEVSDFVKWWNNKVIGGEDVMSFGADNIMAKLARMRHILGLAKINPTVEFLEDFVDETERKMIVFHHHIDVGDLLHKKIQETFGHKIHIYQLHAGLGPAERFALQEQFNADTRAILIASTLASGEGINLQTCSDAILMERQWNPANEDQAAPGRMKRIGQLAKHINITCITGQGTVDDHLHGIVESKRRHFHRTMNKGEVPSWSQTDIMKELGEAIAKDYRDKHGK
jgi:SNF2-related domain/Helicase conserved C-terminal domain/SprT-like family